MELSAEQVGQIKQILEVELPKALEELWDRKAPEMEAAIATRVYRNVRKPQQREHAENRTRLQAIDAKADTARSAALSAEAKTSAVLDRINDHREDTQAMRKELAAMGERFSEYVGERKGKHAERRRLFTWGSTIGKVVGAVLGGGGVAEMIKRFHKH